MSVMSIFNPLIFDQFIPNPCKDIDVPGAQKFQPLKLKLSIEEFRNTIDTLIVKTVIENKIHLVFYLVLKFSANSRDEICGRYIWERFDAEYHKQHLENSCTINDTIGEVTRDALLGAFFGKNNENFIADLLLHDKDEFTWNKTWNCILNEGRRLKQGINFMVYSFGMRVVKNKFDGHAFVVVQYQDNKEVVYQIFQSCVKNYTLNQSLKEHATRYSQAEFRKFFMGLRECLIRKVWTINLELFYKASFNLSKGFEIGQKNPCRKSEIAISYGEGLVSNVFKYDGEFVSYRKSDIYPAINQTT